MAIWPVPVRAAPAWPAGHLARPGPSSPRMVRKHQFWPLLDQIWPILYLWAIQLKPLSWWSKDKSEPGWPSEQPPHGPEQPPRPARWPSEQPPHGPEQPPGRPDGHLSSHRMVGSGQILGPGASDPAERGQNLDIFCRKRSKKGQKRVIFGDLRFLAKTGVRVFQGSQLSLYGIAVWQRGRITSTKWPVLDPK